MTDQQRIVPCSAFKAADGKFYASRDEAAMAMLKVSLVEFSFNMGEEARLIIRLYVDRHVDKILRAARQYEADISVTGWSEEDIGETVTGMPGSIDNPAGTR